MRASDLTKKICSENVCIHLLISASLSKETTSTIINVKLLANSMLFFLNYECSYSILVQRTQCVTPY